MEGLRVIFVGEGFDRLRLEFVRAKDCGDADAKEFVEKSYGCLVGQEHAGVFHLQNCLATLVLQFALDRHETKAWF